MLSNPTLNHLAHATQSLNSIWDGWSHTPSWNTFFTWLWPGCHTFGSSLSITIHSSIILAGSSSCFQPLNTMVSQISILGPLLPSNYIPSSDISCSPISTLTTPLKYLQPYPLIWILYLINLSSNYIKVPSSFLQPHHYHMDPIHVILRVLTELPLLSGFEPALLPYFITDSNQLVEWSFWKVIEIMLLLWSMLHVSL